MEMSRHAKMPNEAMGITREAMVAANAPAVVSDVAKMALDARAHANASRSSGSEPTCKYHTVPCECPRGLGPRSGFGCGMGFFIDCRSDLLYVGVALLHWVC